MGDDGFDFGDPSSGVAFGLERKNKLVLERIKQAKHASRSSNFVLGLLGFIPLPGAPTLSLVASIAAQAGVVIPPMVNDIGRIYLASPEDIANKTIGEFLQSSVSVSAIDIGSQFGIDMLTPIINEVLAQAGIAVGATAIPIIGAVLGIGVDLYVMPRLTEKIGKATAIYFQNRCRWRNGDQSQTIRDAASIGEDLNDIRRNMGDVNDALLSNVVTIVRLVRAMDKDGSKEAMDKDSSKEWVREVLREGKFP